MPLTDPQLSTGEDRIVKEILKLNLINEDVSNNKQNYANFYECLEPLEGMNNNTSDTETSEEISNDIEEDTSIYNIKNQIENKQKIENIEQEDTWYTSHTDTSSSEEDNSQPKLQQKHKNNKNNKKVHIPLTSTQRKDWMDKHTREKYLPEKGDRRKNWARTPTKNKDKNTIADNESVDNPELSELKLRLELNGINLHEATRQIGNLWDPLEDDRTHPSRKNQIRHENNKENI